MKYFNEIMEIEEMRNMFRSYCLELHPDKGGDHNEFIAMKDEYDKIINKAAANESIRAAAEDRKPNFSFESERELAEMIEKLMRVQGVIIELCGSWLWISGNTFVVHEQLKAFGFRYSRKKKSWYYSPYMSSGKRRGRYSMKKIRETFGSTVIEGSQEENLIAA
jgi:hypothetical protein